MIKQKNIFLNYLSYFLLFLFISFFGFSYVSAADVDSSNFSTKFYYWDINSSVNKSTDYKSSNEVTMNSTSDNTSGKPGQFFTGFYTQINGLELKANTQYVFTIKLHYQGLYYDEIAGSYISRLASNNFTKSTATINNVVSSYKLNCPTGGNIDNGCLVDIILTYTLTPTSYLSTLYVGSYSTSNYNMGFQNHVHDVYVVIDSISYQEKMDDTLINQNQTIIDQNNQTNEELGNINDNITNDNVDNDKVSNAFNEFESFVDENATISSLLTLPVTLFTAILNGMQNTCTPFNLGSLYGEDLVLPCIDISSYLGSGLWTMIDIIISGFAIYFISQKFIKVFNTFSSMKEGDVIDD